MNHRFDELASIDTLSIPSIDDEDDMMLYKRFIGEDEEVIQQHNFENNNNMLNRKPKNVRRREFGEIVEEVIINDDEDGSSSGSEKYISPRENKYLDEVNELLGKAKAERENSPTKQTTPDTARFLTKIKKSLEDNLDDVIEESTRLLKEALPMFSYETKQASRENFSDLIKRQQQSSAPKKKEEPSSLLISDFDDIPMMTISKPINEFPYNSSEYRNYEVFESKKNKKLLDKDHDDISTKFFPHLHETIQRSTPLKNKRLKSNIVKTPKANQRNDEYYAKSTEILPSSQENRHVYEMDEDPSPKKEEEIKHILPLRTQQDKRQPITSKPKTLTEFAKPKEQEKKTIENVPKEELKEKVNEVTETEDRPLVFEYIQPKKREIEFASPSSPVEPFEQEEPIEEPTETGITAEEENSPRVINQSKVLNEPIVEIEEHPNDAANDVSTELENKDEFDNKEEPLTIQSFEDFKFDSNELSPVMDGSVPEPIEDSTLNEDESFNLSESPLISRDLDNIGFQDIIRDLNFTTETILRTCSSSVVDIEPINIPNFIPQGEDQAHISEPIGAHEPEEPHTPPREETVIPFSPMIYDQYSPIHHIPSPQSPIETPSQQPIPPKKKISSNINKKKTINTPREQNAPLEESFIPYSGVRHLQKTTYNHSTIDWYLNLCSNKYSRTPSTNQNNTDKGVVKWV